MTRVGATALVAAFFFTGAPVAQSTALVTFEVVVERTDGSFVDNLTSSDFVVALDNLEAVVEASEVDDSAVSVVVMFDTTSSLLWPGMEESRIGNSVSINDNLLAQFRSTDRVRVASFAQRVTMAPAFTTDRSVWRRSLKELLTPPATERSGPSPIWDAVDAAITALEPEPGRRAVILITDGKATGNHKNRSEVESRAAVLGVPVSTIAVGSGDIPVTQTSGETAVIRPGLALEHLAAATGGLALGMPHDNVLPNPMTTVALALRRAYRLSVRAELEPNRSYAVTIRSGDARHKVRTRSWIGTR